MSSNKESIRSRFRLWQRVTSILTVFVYLMQTSVGTLAGTLTNQAIETFFTYDPQFQLAEPNGEYLYDAADYVQQGSILNITTIEQFYQYLIKESPMNVDAPTFVPISVGDILTFVPVYKDYKTIGTPFVQIRHVREQVSELLGRNLIDTESGDPRYATEFAQLATLYENAYTYALTEIDLKFGQPLEISRDDAPYNMVWPELRVINGEEVMVPVVYLTASTVGARKVTENTTTFGGEVYFQDVVVDGATVQLGRDAFLRTVQDLTVANGGSIVSAEALNLNVGGSLELLSGQLQANGDVRIGASSVSAETLVHRYDYGYEQGGTYGEIASISANGDVLVRSYSDIELLGALVDASGGITFAADGNIYIGSQQIVTQGQFGDGWNGSYTNVDFLQSKLTSGETLSLIANGQIVLDAAEITSKGHIEILAGLGITVNSLTTSEQYSKTGKFGNTTKNIDAYKTVAMRSLLDAGESITLHTDYGNVTLQASQISSTDGTSVSASNGSINLLVARENDQFSYSSVKESTVRTVYRQRGYSENSIVYPSIVGGIKTEALYGLNVEFGVDSADVNLSLEQQLAKINGNADMAWLQSLKDDPNVNWSAVETSFEEWNKRQSALNPAVMAVIVIVVAIATSGAGLALTSGSQLLLPALASAPTLTATQAALVAITNAAFTSLVTQVSIGVANGDGVNAIEDGLKYVVSDDSLKNLAATAITAGVMTKLDTPFFNEVAEGAGVGAENVGFVSQTAQVVTESVVRVGATTLLHGGGSSEFDQMLIQNLGQRAIDQLGNYMAEEIGVAFSGSDAGPLYNSLRYIAHAGTGCIIGAASSSLNSGSGESGCAAGAGGAVIGELVGDIYSSTPSYQEMEESVNNLILTPEYSSKAQAFREANPDATNADLLQYLSKDNDVMGGLHKQWADLRQKGADLARLSAALGAAIAGANPDAINISADAGYRAAYYNALLSWQSLSEYLELLDQYGAAEATLVFVATKVREEFIQVYKQRLENGESVEIGTITINGEELPITYASMGGIMEALVLSGQEIAFTGDLYTSPAGAITSLIGKGEDALEFIQNLDQIPEIPSQLYELYRDAHSLDNPEAQAELASIVTSVSIGVAVTVVTAGVGVAIVGAKLAKNVTRLAALIKDLPSEMKIKVDSLLKTLVPIKISHNAKHHLVSYDGFTSKKGIKGAHNIEEFLRAVDKHSEDLVIINQNVVADGIIEIRYGVRAKDRALNYTGEIREYKYPKTVYDPAKYSDDMMFEWGLKAARSGYAEALQAGKTAYTASYEGLNFRVFLDRATNEITNFHPKWEN